MEVVAGLAVGHGSELGVHMHVYRVGMGLPSAAAGDAPACPETQLASGAQARTLRSFCRSRIDGCRYSCVPHPHHALSSREALLMQDCNRVASGRRWQRYAIEHGLEALNKPQPINFCRPKMCLMAAYVDTIRLLGNALITSTGPGERVLANIKAWSKRTNHLRHAHVGR